MTFYEHFSEADLEILRARAERIARLSDDQQVDDIITGLTVFIGGEDYVLEIDSLVAIHDSVQITPVPCVPSYVTGVANVRGHVIPVLNLAVLLNIPGSAGQAGSIVVASKGSTNVAFQIEGIGEVVSFESDQVTGMPSAADQRQSPYLTNILSGKYTLVDIESVLSDSALVVDELAT